jgi:hypothetical protein
MAFNNLGKMAIRLGKLDHSPQHLTADEDFQQLLFVVRRLAGQERFSGRTVANTTHAIAKLHAADRLDATVGSVDATLVALEGEAVRTAQDMNSQEVMNVGYAYGSMRRMPGEKTWAALETAALRVAPEMNSRDVANLLWTYATMNRMPGEHAFAALEKAAVRGARDMNAHDMSSTLWSFAKINRKVGNEMWAALETVAVRVAPLMTPQAVANTLWSCNTIRRKPGDKMSAALETAAARMAPGMNSQEVANTLWSYSMLNSMPGDKTWTALENAAGRRVREMTPHGLAQTVFAYATLSILHRVDHPSCYAALWREVCNSEARDFSDESLSMLFHVHLMHTRHVVCLAGRLVTVPHPAWMMVEARDEWMRIVGKVKMSRGPESRSRRSLAQIFDELGVRHEVERRTDDGYFSMDIYLPDYDVAVEFDGPSHYYNASDSSTTLQDASMTRTAKTELRDFFLAKQCARIMTVPWFEFAHLEGSPEEQRLYVKEKLAKEAGVEV